MPTVAEVLDDVAEECSVTPPSNWATSTTNDAKSFRRWMRQTADELLRRVDWPDPITTDTVITGTGVETYSLPSDFKRLTRDQSAVFETTRTRRACIPIATNGQWTALNEFGSAGGNRYYRLSGDEEDGFSISFFQSLETGASVTVSYVSLNWLDVAGTPGSEFNNLTATLLLPREIVEMGVTWRFRRKKGLPFADRLAEYEANIARLANDYRGLKVVDMSGEPPMRSPFDIPVPDFIPPA